MAVSVNGLLYRTKIYEFLRPELEYMDVDDILFRPDSATRHTSGETVRFLHENFQGRVIFRNDDYNWPPRSCDLTTLNVFFKVT